MNHYISIKSISDLRKAGNLSLAYKEAKERYLSSKDIWSSRAMAWVLLDLLKTKVQERNTETFAKGINSILSIGLSSCEEILYEQLAWATAKFVSSLPSSESNNLTLIFECIRKFTFKPSKGYSYLFRAFHSARTHWPKYLDFCEWWNLDNLRKEDYEYFTNSQNKKTMSLAEQAYIGYANAIINTHDNERMRTFLPYMEILIQKHPEYKYPLYFKSKMLLSIGEKESAFKALLPLAKTKSNEFWIWQILGDTAKDKDTSFACYCRALICPCKEQMLVKIKEQYASMLIERNMFDEAKTEILQTIKIREQNDWKLTSFLENIQNETWFRAAHKKESNIDIYRDHSREAETLTFDDSHKFRGRILIPNGKSFAIVIGEEQIFIPSYLAKGLRNNETTEGLAIKSFDKKKNREGWTAIRITKTNA